MFERILFAIACLLVTSHSLPAQGPSNGSNGLLAPPTLVDKEVPIPSVSRPARIGGDATDVRGPASTANSNAASVAPAVTNSSAAPETTEPERSPTRVSRGTGVLPNDHGQVWREYDISPYTSKVTTTEKPEQALIDWILRDTGTEVWFSEPLGILNADKNTLRVYHTPEMQKLVASLVDRFVATKAESQALMLRLVTISNPNWRTKAMPLLIPVAVQSPGIDAWLTSRENAAFLLGELAKRNDYREHNSPNLVIHNGQAHTVSRLRPKTYARSVKPRDTVLPGFDTETGTIEEGFSLQISPLFALDAKSVDAVVKCHIDQVERLVPVSIDLPSFGGQAQRAQVQVPQLVSWRLHERFRWPTDQVLILGCGVVAAPGADSRNPVNIMNAMSTAPSRADALLFIECLGKTLQMAVSPLPQTSLVPSKYRGRY